MSIYLDKKTGKFRVEVTVGGQRRRGRASSMIEAKALEAQMRSQEALKVSAGPEAPKTLSAAVRAAFDLLWGSARTRDTVHHYLELAVRDLKDPRLTDISNAMLADYAKALAAGDRSNGTVNRRMTILNRLFRHCADMGWMAPVKTTRLKEKGLQRRDIPQDILDAMMAEMGRLGRDDLVDLMKVALQTGMRRGELLSLTPDQIEGDWIRLWDTKTDEPRSVPLTPDCREILERRVPFNVSERTLRYYWDLAKDNLGYGDLAWLTFHAIRHTTATRLVRQNVNLRVVQKYLGHRNIQTTIGYTKVADDDLTQAARRVG